VSGPQIDQDSASAAFTPNLSILVAMGLALCSIAVLIYFFHHVARSIHISHVIADIGDELLSHIGEFFPEDVGRGRSESEKRVSIPEGLPQYFQEPWPQRDGNRPVAGVATISADKTGYVQAIDADTILEVASERDLVIRLECYPGDFLQRSSAAFSVWPKHRLADDTADTLRGAIIAGRLRTPVQDVSFLFEQLVEIAVRALSPGVNDPFTAKSCINWLGVAIEYLFCRALPDQYRIDADNNVRVVAYPKKFGDFVAISLGQMIPYVSRDVNVSLHLCDTVEQIAAALRDDEQREALRDLLSALVDSCNRNLLDIDRPRVAERASDILADIDRPMFGHYAGEPITDVSGRG
jgi:uncharacterized membrane protein